MIKSAFEQLKNDEGFSAVIYKCTADKNSIGYGRNLDDNPLTIKEAEYLLNSDLEKIARQAQKLSFYPRLSPERRGVIINMIYTMGLSRFKRFKRMIAAIYIEDYEMAAREMLDSLWHRKLSETGSERAIRLAKIMNG